MLTTLHKRVVSSLDVLQLRRQGLDDILARLLAARGVRDRADIVLEYRNLESSQHMLNLSLAAEFLLGAILDGRRILTVADYDCDGATACSVMEIGMQCVGANHGYMVPDRKIHGYGLTPSIVDEAMALNPRPEIILTVDNGISSHAGIDRAREYGVDVVVTDHHHAPVELPKAKYIINPNQPGCGFTSKSIAGCGVAWYLMREIMLLAQSHGRAPGCDPAELLTYVALGTVADVVALDRNNRIMVSVGLDLIRSGVCSPGVLALAQVAGKDYRHLTCQDIGFGIGPRVNAAGRLAHMGGGIECLTTFDEMRAKSLAHMLDETNEERKAIQAEMVGEALAAAEGAGDLGSGGKSIVVFGDAWHEGVVGVVAGRLKELHHRPTFVLCRAGDGNIKGSGRSIPGLHLKHVLDSINAKHPGILLKFGGHAMAAGLTIAADSLEVFRKAFEAECERCVSDEMLRKVLRHDGEVAISALSVDRVRQLEQMVWGQEFEPPVFVACLGVDEVKVMGKDKTHLRFKGVVAEAGRKSTLSVVAFGRGHLAQDLSQAGEVVVAFKPAVNEFRGERTVQALAELVDGFE